MANPVLCLLRAGKFLVFPSEEDKVLWHSQTVGCWQWETVLMGALEEGVLLLSLAIPIQASPAKQK